LADTGTASGYKYDSDSIDPISYRFFSVDSLYETAFKDAEADWDATSAPGYIQEQSWSLDPEINVIDGEFTGTFWAATAFYAEEDNTYDGNEVTIGFDTGDMASLSAIEKQIVAEHEIGHAYGLAEHDANHAHVMIPDGDVFDYYPDLPGNDDVAGVDAVY
jgi:hypothetical protein